MKFSKKISVISLTSALILSSVSPVFANDSIPFSSGLSDKMKLQIASGEIMNTVTDSVYAKDAKISKDKAIEIAKSYVQIPDTYVLQSINFNSNGYSSDISTWNLQFGAKDPQQYYGSINVNINSDTGKLINYNFYDNDPAKKPSYPPKFDLKAAKEVALQLLQKYNPDEQKNLLYNDDFEKSFKTPLNGNVNYTFRFDRAENGIRFQNNNVNITIDGDGKFISYNQQWTPNVTFADASKVMTVEQATYTFKTATSPVLNYIVPWNTNGKQITPLLAYNLNSTSIDAITGKPVADQNNMGSLNTTPLTEKPLAEITSANLNLTKDQAVKIAAAFISLPDNAVLQNANYNENVGNLKIKGSGSSSWNLNWTIPGEKDSDIQSINAAINSQNGQLMNYNNYQIKRNPLDSTSTATTKITLDKAKAAAIDFVKKVVPQYTNQLALDEQNLKNVTDDVMKQSNSLNFNFRRVIQGILTENEAINVGVDLQTGEITNFWSSFTTLEYPSTKPVVLTEQQALDTLLTQYSVELYYTLPNTDMNYMNGNLPIPIPVPGTKPVNLVAVPTYTLVPKQNDNAVFLDAISGEWKKRDTGEVTSLEKIVATDIENHWGQKELQLMIDYNALDVKNGKVMPDQAITRGEMIKMLVIAMNGGNNYFAAKYSSAHANTFMDVAATSAYFPYVESAVDSKLIDSTTSKNFNPDGKMTRDEFAQLIVRALGYDKLADYSNLFKLDYKDADQVKHKGQVAIAVALGILTTTDGSFQPEQEVTRAQAAIAFSRYLQKRSVLQDLPINVYNK
ncbi:MAG: S-layer domain protein [Bacilli bacterium]|nr:S-layer domain protein [Bacilli bacterium]